MAKTKSGLGRGLDVLIPGASTDKKSEVKVKETTTLKLSQIEPNRKQPRKKFDEESLAELTQSIQQYGVIEPIVVCKRDDYYEIVAGERRWRAAKKAGLKEIPVVLKEYSEKEIAEISLIENIQREDLNPVEEAKAYKVLIDEYKLTQEGLAERVSKSRSAITNALRLLKLHDKVQKMLVDGKITAGHARALLAIEDKDTQLMIAQKVIDEGLSVRQTEDLVKAVNTPVTEKKPKIRNNTAYKDLEKRLTEVMGTKVRIRQSEEGKGKVEISYYSEEQLDAIYKVINKGTL
ncbi:MAG: ParB/RepB/Spo0J family partition protein [Lachnospiraceae bacterium]|nr:ParB/RepB/Spo0J family partition protein [Lachnospiraceae bacterium]